MSSDLKTADHQVVRDLYESERAQNLITSSTDYVQSIYGIAKANLVPKSQLDRLNEYETAIAERVTKLATEYPVIDTLDSAVVTVRSRATSASDKIVAARTEAVDRFDGIVNDQIEKIVAARAEAVDRFDGIVNVQIDRLEKVLGSLLDSDSESEELDTADVEAQDSKPLPRMAKIGSRVSKKLKKRAFTNLTALRERTEQVQHLDLIQYAADYLDIDEKDTRERITKAREYVSTKTAPVADMYNKAVETTTTTVAEVQREMDERRGAVIKRAQDFYAVLVVEYLGMEEKDVSAKTFVARMRTVLGEAWNVRLAQPTEKYFDYIKAEWAKTEEQDGEKKVADTVTEMTQIQARRVDQLVRNVIPQAKAAVVSAFTAMTETVKEQFGESKTPELVADEVVEEVAEDVVEDVAVTEEVASPAVVGESKTADDAATVVDATEVDATEDASRQDTDDDSL